MSAVLVMKLISVLTFITLAETTTQDWKHSMVESMEMTKPVSLIIMEMDSHYMME